MHVLHRLPLLPRPAIVGLAAATWLSASTGRATCEGPTTAIVWTYPDDATTSVPPNAVFWVVPEDGNVSVEVDGVALDPLGPSGAERLQFAPSAPLEPGAHELVARSTVRDATLVDSSVVGSDERHIRFQVAAEPESVTRVFIRSVRVYPYEYGTEGEVINPAPDEYDGECSQQAIPLSWACNDIIPLSLTRIGFDTAGASIATLIGNDVLVPPGCTSFWTSEGFEAPNQVNVTPVLPTGLGERAVFDGTIEQRSGQQAAAGAYSHPSACAIGFGKPASNAFGTIAGLAWLAYRGRRRR